ncbi:MAG: HAD family phosphatase [Parcubacteria group bacterium]|nr:HAD family phosphatase [Parcubacteria group bacterium]
MIRGIAFDLDGTLVDLEHLHFDGFIFAAREHGVSIDFEGILEHIPDAIGGGDQKIAEGISALCKGVKPSSFSIKERKKHHYNRLLAAMRDIEPREGFLPVFKKIKAIGMHVAIGSSTPNQQAWEMLRKAGVSELFDPSCVILGEDVKNLKPAPDIFLATASRMGIAPSEQLVFEDSAVGVLAARNAGSQVIGVPVFHFPKLIRQITDAGALRIFFDWKEIDISDVVSLLNSITNR